MGKLRAVKDLTDDDIVDAVAGEGREGLDIEDVWEGNAFHAVCVRLGLLEEDEGDEDVYEPVEAELAERMRALSDRLTAPTGDVMHLTSAEWGRRLAGKSAEEIATTLRGTGGF